LFYVIEHPQSGRVLDIAGYKDCNGTEVILWDKHCGWNQQWIVDEEKGIIINPYIGKVLDIVAEDRFLQLWDEVGDEAEGRYQRWVIDKKDGVSTIAAKAHPGKVLDTNGMDRFGAKYANIILSDKNEGDGQKWVLKLVD